MSWVASALPFRARPNFAAQQQCNRGDDLSHFNHKYEFWRIQSPGNICSSSVFCGATDVHPWIGHS